MSRVFFHCFSESFIFAEHFNNLFICSESECSQKCSDRLLPCTVYSYRYNTVGVSLIFKPCPSVRNDLCREQFIVRFVTICAVVRSRRSYKLSNNYSLRTIVYKSSLLCHQREISHEYFLLFNLFGLSVNKSYTYLKGCSISNVSGLTFFLFVFWRIT